MSTFRIGCIFAVALMAAAGTARAEPFNYGGAPLGAAQAGMGGVQAAWADALSAVSANPASIAWLAPDTWHGEASGFLQLGDALQERAFLDQDIRLVTIDGMLSFAGAGRAERWGGWAVAFMSPERRVEEALKQFGPLSTPRPGQEGEPLTFPRGNLFVDARTSVFDLGPAGSAWIIPERLSIGIGAFYTLRRSQIARAYSLTTSEGDFLSLQTSYEQLSQALRLDYGIRGRPVDALVLGASVSHTVPLRDDVSVAKLIANFDRDEIREMLAELFQGRITEDEAIESVFREGFASSSASYRRPVAFRFGGQLEPTSRLRCLAELAAYFPVEQNLPELPPPFATDSQETVVNVHAGVEGKAWEETWLRGGFRTDFSSRRSLASLMPEDLEATGFDRRTPRDTDLYHATLGVSHGEAPVTISAALDYAWGSGRIIDILGNTRLERRRDLVLVMGTSVRF